MGMQQSIAGVNESEKVKKHCRT